MSEDTPTISLSDAQRPFYAGVDLGGTNIKVGLVDDLGRTLAFEKIATRSEQGPETGAQRMGQAVLDLIQQLGARVDDVTRVGLATPGTMDVPAGMLLEPHNLPGWYHFPVRDRVSEHCGLPVTYSNDAGAAAYGEFWVGSGRQLNSMILLTLGTGVGGGIIIGDQSIDGEHSTGAECGHITIDCRDDARVCGCGRPGHLEAYASATGLIARACEALDSGRTSSLQAIRESGQEITPLLIAQEAEADDEFSRELVMDTADYLGVGIATLMATIDPSGVVLGGAMTFGGHESQLGRDFLRRVKEEVCRRSLTPIIENLNINFASLGGDAGYLGAAGLARVDARK